MLEGTFFRIQGIKDISFHEMNNIFLYNLDGNLNLKELYSNLEHQRKGMGSLNRETG